MRIRKSKQMGLLFLMVLTVTGIISLISTQDEDEVAWSPFCISVRTVLSETGKPIEDLGTKDRLLFRTITAPVISIADGSVLATYQYTNWLNCLNQDEDLLVSTVRDKYLLSPNKLPYNLSFLQNPNNLQDLTTWFFPGPQSSHSNGSYGAHSYSETHTISDYIDRLVFKGRLRNGFFIESGAEEMGRFSISLFFEIYYNWTGLLIEPEQEAFVEGMERNRKATTALSCLSLDTIPSFVKIGHSTLNYNGYLAMSHILQSGEEEINVFNSTKVTVQCFPLYSYLLAVGNPTVNLWVLDIEGAEFGVLKTIPWDKVDIEVMVIETVMAGQLIPGTKEDIRSYVKKQGYTQFQPTFEEKLYGKKVAYNDFFVSDKAMLRWNVTPIIENYPNVLNRQPLDTFVLRLQP